MTVDVHGPLCMCGNHGCLETHFSSQAPSSCKVLSGMVASGVRLGSFFCISKS
jgi:hypothetical protein